MSEETKPATVPSVDDVVLWSVDLNDGDWYWVFARSSKEAMRIVKDLHYDGVSTREFRSQYAPVIAKVPPQRRMLVNCEDSGKQFSKTASQWAKGQTPGPFVSNTYDY